jgi:gluconokinase
MIIVVMGVTGSGKTTVGQLLAARLGYLFADADDFHSAANKDKMHKGIPLTDADRLPWLAAMHDQIAKWVDSKQDAVLACSALKQSYRQQLWSGPEVRFVYLKGSYELIAQRLRARKGHFADKHILAGQFADLEEPTDADAIVVDISKTPGEIVEEICHRLGLQSKQGAR